MGKGKTETETGVDVGKEHLDISVREVPWDTPLEPARARRERAGGCVAWGEGDKAADDHLGFLGVERGKHLADGGNDPDPMFRGVTLANQLAAYPDGRRHPTCSLVTVVVVGGWGRFRGTPKVGL